MALQRSPTAPNAPPVRQQDYTAAQVADALKQSRGLQQPLLGCSAAIRQPSIGMYNVTPTVAAAKKQAREGVLDLAEAGLIGAIKDREPWAIKYYLSTQGKERGYVEQRDVNHTGAIGSYTIDLGGEDDGSSTAG